VANLQKSSFAKPTGLAGRLARNFLALSFFGAFGIAGFGWALSRLLFFDCKKYTPLWFFAALFIYNLDRLKTDPADVVNTPNRSRATAGLRKTGIAIAAASAFAIIALPVFQRDWLMLLLTLGGATVCINYSLAPLGFRLKDIPLLKTFFAPTLVAAAFFVPPLLQQRLDFHTPYFFATVAWTFCALLFNMILCDMRDMRGDAGAGVRTLPVLLGVRGTAIALVTLLVFTAILSVAAILNAPPARKAAWMLLSPAMVLWLGSLLAALRKPRSESFYEWWVEGILFLPPLAVALAC
jgi:4-hydroxybenzoate polyprenyltransferase